MVPDASRYAGAKAAADAGYQAWAGANPFSSVFAPLSRASIVGLNQPGTSASAGGGSTPPDPTGAASAGFYVEFVNSRISVYNRSTLASPPLATATEDAFTLSSSTCDGQIKWDQAAQRFEYYSLDCGASAGRNGFSFGWSKTNDPTNLTATGWCKYHVNTAGNLEDYGKLGNDDSFMIVGSNEFNDTSGYTDSPVFALAKPANGATTCPASSAITKFAPPAANEGTPEPANIFGGSPSGYVVAVSGSLSNALRMYTLSGTTTPVLNDNGNITVPAFATPANVPQPAPAPASDQLDSSDARLTQAAAAFDPAVGAITVWTQHTIAGAGGGPSVVRWYELKAGRSTPVQAGTIAVSGEFAFNGAISPTIQGNAAAIEYNVGGGNLLVQVRAQIHAIGTPPGTTGNETVLATSSAVDNDFSCPSRASAPSCRWGDYAGASFDPLSGDAVWGANQLDGPVAGGNAQWRTQNFRLLLPDELPTGAFTATASTPPAHTEKFSGGGSTDPDGSIVSWTWTFGDGTTATGATVSHTYSAAGTKTVNLTVKDSAGLTSSVTRNVTIP